MGDLSLWNDNDDTSISNTITINKKDGFVPSVIKLENSTSRTNKEGFNNKEELDDEQMVFRLDRVQFELPSALRRFAVNNNILIMALEDNRLLIVDLVMEVDVKDIEIPIDKDDITINLFIDPSGQHIFLNTRLKKNFYYHNKFGKMRQIQKLNGHQIECIAWDKTQSPEKPGTGQILFGTLEGKIFEAYLEPTEDSFKHVNRHVHHIFTLPDSSKLTSLLVEAFPTSSDKFYLMATTPSRLYQFIGHVPLRNKPEESRFSSLLSTAPSYQDIPGEIEVGQVAFYSQNSELVMQSVVSSFGWLTGSGIYQGDFQFGSQTSGASVIENGQLIPYPTEEIPLSLVVTEFHLLLLYPERILALSRLTFEPVYNEPIPPLFQQPQSGIELIMDNTKKTMWCHTGQSIYEILVAEEDHKVWRYYLDKHQYTEALKYAKNIQQKDMILIAQSNHYFDTKRYQLAANYFGKCNAPLEEISLKFIEFKDMDALRTYLLVKLENLNKMDVTQSILLSSWLVELYLSKINQMEESLKEPRNHLSNQSSIKEDGIAQNGSNLINDTLSDELDYLNQEFEGFLKKYKKWMNSKVIYNLMASYGRNQQLIKFAELIDDSSFVIDHYIHSHKYKEALKALSQQDSPSLFYKFAPQLIKHVPVDLVNLLMRNPQLEAKKLIPTLLNYEPSSSDMDTQPNQAIRYLQFLIQNGNQEAAIHNLLLSLYAANSDASETQLLNFLMSEGNERYYHLDYALRLCRQYHRAQSIVFIYGLMGLHEEAVITALKYDDVELAKIHADKAEPSLEIRKELWLKIAQYLIDEKEDIHSAMDLLQQCDVLKMEDLLPLFPEFTMIDAFKEEICSALETYNTHIEEIRQEMDEATLSADTIRESIRQQRSRFLVIENQERCQLCSERLLKRAFYIFPCQHGFHSDCLLQKVERQMNSADRLKLKQLQQRLTSEITMLKSNTGSAKGIGEVPLKIQNENLVDSELTKAKIEELKDQFDDLIASECCLCGYAMISSITQGFLTDENPDEILSWVI